MTKEELNRKVALTLTNRRQRAVMQAEERRAKAYDKLPRLLVLDNLSIQTGIQLAKLSATGAASELREEQKQHLVAIAAERRELLKEAGYPENYLEEQFTCSVCKDTGRAGGAVCVCVRQLAQQFRREEINARFPLDLCSFETFSLARYNDKPRPEQNGVSDRRQMQEVYDRCRAYAANFDLHAPSLYLFGETGIGKTHLALAIANETLKKGFQVVYVSSQSLFFEMSNDRAGAGELMETLNEADLVILDDLGTELVTPFVLSMLYNLVDTRLGRKRPTVYTTNILSGELLEKRYTEKISSRLLGGCEQYRLLGEDLRLE